MDVSADQALSTFSDAWAARLTTYRRDGTPVPTPVNVVVDGDRICFRTYAQSGKFKRLGNDARVTLQPCDARGNPTGAQILVGEARMLAGEANERVGRLIDQKHRLFQGWLVRTAHRVKGYRTVHFEVALT